METHKIAKWIAMCAGASRRAAERMIDEGRVSVNGETCRDKAVRVSPSTDRATLDGKPLSAPPEARIWRFHKPKGCVTSAGDPEGRSTIYDFLPPEMQALKYVGRLDYNTEGLLLLTNSGAVADAMTSPSSALPRIYRVRAFGRPDVRKMREAQRGAVVDGIRYRPIEIESERRDRASQLWYRLTLREGKNREIRAIMEYCGLQVTRLIRIGYGEYALGDLPPCATREEKLIGVPSPFAKTTA
ncbi:MAG: pseudouridine synthase [Rickettsiales bacterium]